jgi:peptidoglycan/LPS O-acetylase OafA/YrhL
MPHTRQRPTFGQKLQAAGQAPSGFDYLRFALALGVVIWHSCVICYGRAGDDVVFTTPLSGLVKLLLPMFFALSGFLVAGSLYRCQTFVVFFSLRVLRIYPALIAAVLVSALIIGPVLTSLPLRAYVQDPLLWNYLGGISGRVGSFLPGVFATNPLPHEVNRQLWTVPWEITSYVLAWGLVMAGLKRKPELALYAFGVYLILLAGFELYQDGFRPSVKPESGSGVQLVLYFLGGLAAYVWRDRLIWSKSLCLACLLLSAVLLGCVPGGDYLAAVPCIYATVSLGLFTPRRVGFIGRFDPSYGIYVYGFVIQQSVAYVFGFSHVWYINLLFSLPLSLIAGLVSWHLLEKNALRLKSHLKRLDHSQASASLQA